jgi:hypothetical protein
MLVPEKQITMALIVNRDDSCSIDNSNNDCCSTHHDNAAATRGGRNNTAFPARKVHGDAVVEAPELQQTQSILGGCNDVKK